LKYTLSPDISALFKTIQIIAAYDSQKERNEKGWASIYNKLSLILKRKSDAESNLFFAKEVFSFVKFIIDTIQTEKLALASHSSFQCQNVIQVNALDPTLINQKFLLSKLPWH